MYIYIFIYIYIFHIYIIYPQLVWSLYYTKDMKRNQASRRRVFCLIVSFKKWLALSYIYIYLYIYLYISIFILFFYFFFFYTFETSLSGRAVCLYSFASPFVAVSPWFVLGWFGPGWSLRDIHSFFFVFFSFFFLFVFCFDAITRATRICTYIHVSIRTCHTVSFWNCLHISTEHHCRVSPQDNVTSCVANYACKHGVCVHHAGEEKKKKTEKLKVND